MNYKYGIYLATPLAVAGSFTYLFLTNDWSLKTDLINFFRIPSRKSLTAPLKDFQTKNSNNLKIRSLLIEDLKRSLKIDNSQNFYSSINELNTISGSSLFSETLNNSDKVFEIDNKVKNITKELNREDDLSIIKDESDKELSDSKNKLNNLVKNFNSIFTKVKDWKSKSNSLEIRVQKNGQLPEKVIPPSKEERESLFTYYEVFSGLKGDETKLLEGIKIISDYSRYKTSNSMIPAKNKQRIEALKKINWSNSERIAFNQYLKIEPKDSYDPFAILLDSEYLNKVRSKAIEWESKIKGFQSRSSFERCGTWTRTSRLLEQCTKWSHEATQSFQRVKEDIEAQMTMEIASKLINEMTEKLDLEEKISKIL
ncbi:hypothetical protein [Mycoplasma parvum]|uniref:Uncharacterized protein n=1 Tax=Mycoplasma parvum str. Indiana TaxID=1403316 RepID=U5NFL4_9MOLU|nr:hypothetical protein [Mycoplasma parvum]AGX88944.1 hypothetical protein PRV_00895 [Mycoplasma parvum str. Indiana]